MQKRKRLFARFPAHEAFFACTSSSHWFLVMLLLALTGRGGFFGIRSTTLNLKAPQDDRMHSQ